MHECVCVLISLSVCAIKCVNFVHFCKKKNEKRNGLVNAPEQEWSHKEKNKKEKWSCTPSKTANLLEFYELPH